MQQFINYVIDNWQWLLPIVLSIVEFFILLIFKHYKYVDSSICYTLISLIKQAESKFGPGHGAEKLKFVIDEYQLIHPNVKDSIISYFVNEILDTPHKKV